ncbi:thiamine-phosphate kinase [Thermomonas sp. HDW16]|uniref:thiamine-phosphate kinase n=1 Tax=Thermomonas sp. HDW16 TaxID=2714945 RepID=UPI001407A5F1|nr:thiamine-phosphate kinase [Thermomonas sp. HDW16]QIL21460.1 thiamine-phosphate kinase [Thermomonas sp. HDW16]
MGEFDLIARIRDRAATRADVILGIGDDAALLQPPAGMQLVVAMDTLNAGVHFPTETAPADIGWKALAVNLSDLAAMGALPAWCTLSLSLPDANTTFVDGFLDGFLALAQQHDVALVGGDTTRGPLSVCVTVHGFVESGTALRRDGAQIGDDVWASGTLGDAAAALAQWKSGGDVDAALRARLNRPTPRVALGHALRGIATACIDVSDGLLADLGHVCNASGVGVQVDVDALPASEALRIAFDGEARRVPQATGGDDYELCLIAPSNMRATVQQVAASVDARVTRIGRVVDRQGVQAHTADGVAWSAPMGWRHFD